MITELVSILLLVHCSVAFLPPNVAPEPAAARTTLFVTESVVSERTDCEETASPPMAEKSIIKDIETMATYPLPPLGSSFTPTEWIQRCQLAASYRIAHMNDWGENIFNHITVKVSGSDSLSDGPHFLLNDFGMGFDEIDASSLLKVTLGGNIVPPSSSSSSSSSHKEPTGKIFKPGFLLHGAVHEFRHDVLAVWHCHALDSTAVSQTTFGLLPLSQEATYALNKGIGYHPFEGTANDESEKPRLIANLGPKNQILMLEDHGPLVAAPTIKEAFATMFFLTRACKYQIRSLSAVGGDLTKIHMPSKELCQEMLKRIDKFDEDPKGEAHDTEGLMFDCARRAAEREYGAENIYR